jgi:parallel beta-helix repeat protein
MKRPVATRLRSSLVAIAIGVSLARVPADARTWRVTPDGTGDAPSLEAVMDSVSPGDTVLVGPGEHAIASFTIPDAVVVVGEQGPRQTRVVPVGFPILSGVGCGNWVEVSGIWFDGFRSGAGVGALNVTYTSDVRISGCVFTNNEFGISMFTDFGITVESNTFVGNDWALSGHGYGFCTRNIVWDPASGLSGFGAVCNDVLRLEDIRPFDRMANFSLDPQFCGPDDFRIMTTSPCAPGSSPFGENCPSLIGALPVYCSPSLIEQRTWGQIKALYKR